MNNPLDLDAIRKRAESATPGPWVWNITAQINMGRVWWPVGSSPDAEFIAHARTDVPALVAEVERLRGENAELVRKLFGTWNTDGSQTEGADRA